MNPTLYYLPPSPPCRTVLLLSRILNIEFNLKTLNVLESEQLNADFVNLNPQHTIPTLEDHDAGIVLWESRVILTYLTSVHAKDDNLYPKDIVKRALVDQRLAFDLSTLYQRMVEYFVSTH
jgi:glutathione S-transferase